jgi:hypothetical protein
MDLGVNQQRYFVIHLEEMDRPIPGKEFEIQVLDSEGRAACCGYVGKGQLDLVVAGKVIPRPVIEAAHRQTIGQGEYVDQAGNSVSPF